MEYAARAMTLEDARRALGVAALATPGEVRRAFREAAKRAHPDRPGGGAEAFRKVVSAYQRLNGGDDALLPAPEPAPVASEPAALAITPQVALDGGEVEHELEPGRRIRITLPPGLRSGDKVGVGEERLRVTISADPDLRVRGDDLWMTVKIPSRTLAAGGRIAIDTPLGRRIVWITRKVSQRGLLRIAGQGLPPRGRHKRGHLFLRLAPEVGPAQSGARALLDRFAAAWAA